MSATGVAKARRARRRALAHAADNVASRVAADSTDAA
jgi:hypothetical protein